MSSSLLLLDLLDSSSTCLLLSVLSFMSVVLLLREPLESDEEDLDLTPTVEDGDTRLGLLKTLLDPSLSLVLRGESSLLL